MDNIIVNSALWYAEQSSQFLLNSGANKLLDKGYDYYVKEFIPLGHRLIQNGQIAADAMDGELPHNFRWHTSQTIGVQQKPCTISLRNFSEHWQRLRTHRFIPILSITHD